MIKYLSPEVLLFAYQQGLFPMAESRNAKQVQWIQPKSTSSSYDNWGLEDLIVIDDSQLLHVGHCHENAIV